MTEFKWWCSQDRERWQGPFDTKEIAISEGRKANEYFYICEACLEDYHKMIVDPDEVLEQVSNRYYLDFSSEEAGLFEDVTLEQNIALRKMLSKTLHEWIETYNVKTGIYVFAESRNEETIKPEDK